MFAYHKVVLLVLVISMLTSCSKDKDTLKQIRFLNLEIIMVIKLQ